MTYLVMDNAGHRIVTAENLRLEIDNGTGRMRIFRLCDLKDPKELVLRWFGNVWALTDMYGNPEPNI